MNAGGNVCCISLLYLILTYYWNNVLFCFFANVQLCVCACVHACMCLCACVPWKGLCPFLSARASTASSRAFQPLALSLLIYLVRCPHYMRGVMWKQNNGSSTKTNRLKVKQFVMVTEGKSRFINLYEVIRCIYCSRLLMVTEHSCHKTSMTLPERTCIHAIFKKYVRSFHVLQLKPRWSVCVVMI